MAKKADIKEFDDACRQVGLTEEEAYAASADLHAEKQGVGDHRHRSYGDLVAWLRQWKAER